MFTDDKLLIWLYNKVKHLEKNLGVSGSGGGGTPGQKGDRGEKGNDCIVNSRIFRITFKEPFDNPPFIELYHNDNTARLNYVFNITNTFFDLSTNYVYDTRIYRYFAFDTN